jgi:hypothetical protein
MQDIRNTLDEGLDFYREQERLVSARLAVLPKGRIKSKRLGGNVYYYLHYRKGKETKSDYLGKKVPLELRELLEERARLESELRRIREGLRLLRSRPSADTDLSEPIRSILKKMTEEKLWDSGLEIIGTWCFLLYQRHLPMDKYPLKTEDLDFLVPLPYKGKPFDFSVYLRALGFRQDFHADGSMSFSGNLMKVEFLAPDKGSGRRPAPFIQEISVTPQMLRFVDILLAEPMVLRVARGIKARVPAPAAFSLHKLIISTRAGRRAKKDKDIRQAIIAAKYVLSDQSETKKLRKLWDSFPGSWKKRVHSALRLAEDFVPLERGVILRLRKFLA